MAAEVNRLFIAVPRLSLSFSILDELSKRKFISKQERELVEAIARTLKRTNRTVPKASGKSVLAQIMIVAPEIFSSSTVDFLRKINVVSLKEAQQARLLIRAAKAAKIGTPVRSYADLLERLTLVEGAVISNDMLDILREYDLLSVEEAALARAAISSADTAKKVRKKLQGHEGDDLARKAMVILPEILTRTTIRSLLITGVIDKNTANILNRFIDYGPTAWKAFEGARREKGFAQRMLMASQALFSQELVDLLLEVGLISPEIAKNLRPAITASRQASRQLIDRQQGGNRKYRVIAGESPIKTYARTSRDHDNDILKLLAEAARDAGREAERLANAPGIGAKTRRAQYQIQAAELHRVMREMWEGVGYLTIIGERDTAEAAVEAMEFLNGKLWNSVTGEETADELRAIMRQQARGGVDHYISRQENLIGLSRRVYRNMDLWQGRVDALVNSSLLQGQGAKEIADKVSKYIRPDVKGGVSYAAMRLARTELNNAFHFTSIRQTRDQPWVTGYKWHLSKSHPGRDECNEYAEDDHGNLGKGVFPKSKVPGKPHPNCLCYITPETVSPQKFQSGFREGRYNKYWKEIQDNGVFGDPYADTTVDAKKRRALDIKITL